ncbi:MAG: hypothetical protein N2652_00525 [Kiritimatiellae bacterium]|nr:hypothetical protein [Kiritimatiellia bacterium]
MSAPARVTDARVRNAESGFLAAKVSGVFKCAMAALLSFQCGTRAAQLESMTTGWRVHASTYRLRGRA